MSHRITNGMMVSNFMLDYQNNLTRMDTWQRRMATGRQIVRMSDDPIGVINSMSARTRLSSLEQYQRNLGSATDWLNATETCTRELNEIIQKAYEYTVDIASDENNKDDRKNVATYIEELAKHVVQIGNSDKGGKFLFAGFNTLQAPFKIEADGSLTYNGNDITTGAAADIKADPMDASGISEWSQIMTYEVGFGIKQQISTTGLDMMGVGEENIYKIMMELADKLRDETVPTSELSTYITRLQEAQNRTLGLTTQIGGNCMRMELLQTRYEEDALNTEALKSRIEDADEAEAIMYFKMAEAVYNAALAAGAKIMQPTLLNYL